MGGPGRQGGEGVGHGLPRAGLCPPSSQEFAARRPVGDAAGHQALHPAGHSARVTAGLAGGLVDPEIAPARRGMCPRDDLVRAGQAGEATGRGGPSRPRTRGGRSRRSHASAGPPAISGAPVRAALSSITCPWRRPTGEPRRRACRVSRCRPSRRRSRGRSRRDMAWWSRSTGVMTVRRGRATTLVASSRPPRPTSIRHQSAGASAMASRAAQVVISK